jgi:hypothetical protein
MSGVSAITPLVAFNDIHGGKREVLFFYFVPDTTRDTSVYLYHYLCNAGWNGGMASNPVHARVPGRPGHNFDCQRFDPLHGVFRAPRGLGLLQGLKYQG